MALAPAPTHIPQTPPQWVVQRGPGVGLCLLIAGISVALQAVETRLFGRAWLEALVIAILLGAAIRTVWTPSDSFTLGVDVCAKLLLEIAVTLLGATVSAKTIASAGPALLIGIAAVVVISLFLSYGVGRLLRLPHRMAVLIACGNSICGNSAIAAVAPIIGAEGDDVAASIAFTAVLGVAVVLGLPVLAIAWGMTPRAFGVLAGLTVYAVPQVLAATAPISSLSAQVGTLVKLIRVLMLGPVVLALSLISRETVKTGAEPGVAAPGPISKPHLRLDRLVPWFIVGFLVLVGARSVGAIPVVVITPISNLASGLTVIAMAALGLGVDVRIIAKAGPAAITVVTLSLLALGGVALGLIHILNLT